MLNIETKKHDQFTLELKVGYSHGDQRQNQIFIGIHVRISV